MSLNTLGKLIRVSNNVAKLQFGYRPLSANVRPMTAKWYSTGIQRSFTRSSRWYMCANKQQANVNTSHFSPCSARCGCAQLHTAGDKEIVEFLGKEIKYEKERQQTPSKLKGFEITSSNGAEVTLTKKQQNETIVVRVNVNNSVDDENAQTFEEEGSKEPKESEPQMVSRPAFVVEISKGGNTTLAIQCAFPPNDVDLQGGEDGEQYADLIEIEEVALLSKGKEWDEKIYVVSGPVMDGTMYDMLLNMLEERGIDGDFVEQLVTFSTAYEHGHYVNFLEKLKDFVASK